MAIKDKDEMFGDGTAGNPQVPIDLTAPPGFNALSRGVAFGEQVTSAIKNRTPYALVLNDEDLNTRLADFEVRGLDGAYDLGTLGPAGGGKAITKDAGAIETSSTLATQYLDDPTNAHWRADMSGDSVAGGTGFEAIGALGLPMTGFIDRTPIALSDDTIFAGAGETCTVGSGGANRIELTGAGQWKTGAATNLGLTFEVVEIKGATTGENGLYVLDTFVTDDIATFLKLDGTAAAFTTFAGATAILYRRKFASAQVGAGTLLGSVFHGEPGDSAALILVPGQSSPTDPSGADNALMATYRDTDGSVYSAHTIDAMGRSNTVLPSNLIDATEDLNFGLYGHFIDKSLSTHGLEAGVIFQQAAVTDAHGYAMASLIAMDDSAGLDLVPDPCNFNNTAFSNRIDCTGASGTDFQRIIGNGTTFCEIISGPAGQPGFYYVDTKVGNTTLVVALMNLDGTVASFPGAGAPPDGTCRFFTGVAIGKRILDSLNTPIGNFTVSADWRGALTVQAPYDDTVDSGGILITMPDVTNADAIRVYKAGLAGARDEDRLNFAVNIDGDTYTRRNYYAGDGSGIGEFLYQEIAGRTKTIMLPLAAGFDANNATPTPGWFLFQTGAPAYRLSSQTGGAEIVWPLSAYLPTGAVITLVRAKLRPGAAATRAVVDRMELQISDQNPLFGTPLSVTTGNLRLSIVEDGTSVALDRIVITSGAISIVVDNTNGEETNLAILAGDSSATDGIMGIEITYLDPGPRNLGE